MIQTAPTSRSYPAKPSDIYLFATCLVDQFAPEAGVDVVNLLEREGIRVHFPEGQTCCGQPAYTSGYPHEARAVARQQIALFPEPWPIVVPSGSCAAMMRHHYPDLFSDDPILHGQAMRLSDRIFEFTEFMVHVLDFHRADRGGECTVALHTSCHARREMGSHETSATLLRGLEHVNLAQQARAAECCGFGGTFSIVHPDISAAIAGEKVDSLRASGAERVVSADCGCLFNILGRSARIDELAGDTQLGLQGEHIASFIWRRTQESAQ
jgi:L-lactate dehydrogenase complex protein LldE